MTLSARQPAREGASATTLYVDLDGTLIATDLLWESVCRLAQREPASLLRLPFWLARGRAALKRELAARVDVDVATLPYREEVLAYVRGERANGRRTVLATASDASLAHAVAAHTGLFDDVIGSDGTANNKAEAKLRAIREREGDRPFEYAGDARADLAIWRGAVAATVVAASPGTERAARALGIPVRTLSHRGSALRPALRALRPYQWVKNVLLFAPILLAHEIGSPTRLAQVVAAFVSFCCVASATYLWNDLLDVEADRRHPRKRERPFAAGALAIPTGFALSLALLAAGVGLSLAVLNAKATAMLLGYLALTTSYSFYFKERVFLDVLLLAGLYTHRILAGGAAAGVAVSPWLLAFSMFFFLSLAFVKRYAELLGAKADQREKLDRRGYEVDDIGLVENMGTTSGYMSVLVLALYVSSDSVERLYASGGLLWGICPIMLFWVTRIWFLARRGEMTDDPVLFAATDRVSYLAGAAIALVGIAAALR
ncbi:MAG: UbiA family prenyltransferase [Myxococcota bacterium]|nr:UbiA family prenyltransferase [Myxococcales bacterium]